MFLETKQMKDKICFFDTNIIVYLYSSDEPDKRSIANRLFLEAKARIISTQVINELSNVLQRKKFLAFNQIRAVATELVSAFILHEVDFKTIDLAYQIADKYKFSYFDSLIASSALKNNCQILYSEDLQANQIIQLPGYDGVTIINPFKQ